MRSDANIGADFRKYVTWWAGGSKQDRLDLYDELDQADRSGFPREPALEALSKLAARMLWKTFAAEDLRQLHDWAQEAGLTAAAERFQAAEDDIPFRDPGRIPKKIYDGVMARDGRRCRKCDSTTEPQVDHILPWIEGGSSTDPKNLRVLCAECNQRKGPRVDPKSAKGRRRQSQPVPGDSA